MPLKSKNTTRAKNARYLTPRYFKGAYFIGKANRKYKNHVFVVTEAIRPIGGRGVRAIEGQLINTKKPDQKTRAFFSVDLFEEMFYYHDPGS